MAQVLALNAHCSTCGANAKALYTRWPDGKYGEQPFPVEMSAEAARLLEYDCDRCGGSIVCEFAPAPSLPVTVKRLDLFGNVIDTYATEGELNGWRAQQAHLVGKQGGLL